MNRIIKHYGSAALKDVKSLTARIERYKKDLAIQQESIKELEAERKETLAVIAFVKKLKKKYKEGKL